MSSPQEPHILTPDQRLRVFISSTLEELSAERAAVRDAIEALHLVPVMLESAARPYAARELYADYVAQSHVFVGIYAESYGRPAPGKTISRIEDEYEVAAGKPRLLYIKKEAPARDPRLAAMIDRFKEEAGVSFARFRDADELAGLIKNDLVILLTEHFLGAEPPPQDRGARLGARLPAPTSALVGRERELREIRKLLAETRLITVTGPGGTGKTRLALEVIREIEDPDIEGPWLVELAGLQDPGLVPAAIAQRLGLVAQPGLAAVEALGEVIGDRKATLVLDNCEHVIDAASEVVSELLMTCPNLSVLATSREPLRVRGEVLYPLDTLPIIMEGVDGDELDGDAMRMFEARAADVVPGFRLEDSNREAVRRICETLDGLPLAIELAASRLRMLSPQQLSERLDDRFALLAHGPRDLPDRQRTLLATIDWSYESLEGAEQELFRELSVFRGGFELDAVERVTSADELAVLDLLDELVAKSLVSVDPGERYARYSLLDSLRAYGERRFERAEFRELQRRHLTWGVELAAFAEERIRGPEAGYWLDRLDRERDNLRAAFTFAIEEKQLDDALSLAGDLGWFWYRRGYVSEARHWLEPALAEAADKPTKERASALIALAGVEYLDGELMDAAKHASDAIAAAEAVGHVPTQARALLYSAYFHATLGQLVEAEKLASAGRDLAKASGRKDIESETYTALGQLARVQGQADEAEKLFLMGADLADEIGHRWHVGSCYWLASKVSLDRGDAATAAKRVRKALEVITSEGDRTSTLVGLHTMAAALAGTGSPEQGAMLIGAVAGAGEKIGFFPERMDPLDGAVNVERVRTALESEVFEKSYERGRGLSVDEALSIAGVEAPSRRIGLESY